MQACPELKYSAWKAPFTAASMSASGRITLGDLPPSSSVTRFSALPVLAPISRPTTVEPVKAIFSTPGLSTSAAPVVPSPVSTLTTPGGKPASSASSPSRRALSGVCSAGLSTTVHPAASAGPSFQQAISRGKFQGMI